MKKEVDEWKPIKADIRDTFSFAFIVGPSSWQCLSPRFYNQPTLLVFSDGLITCTLFDGVVRHCSSCSRGG